MATEAPRRLRRDEIAEAVDAWLDQHEGETRQAAFAAIGAREGRTRGAVSQAYYAARSKVDAKASRPPRRAQSTAGASLRATAALTELAEYIGRLEAEVIELRAFRDSVVGVLER